MPSSYSISIGYMFFTVGQWRHTYWAVWHWAETFITIINSAHQRAHVVWHHMKYISLLLTCKITHDMQSVAKEICKNANICYVHLNTHVRCGKLELAGASNLDSIIINVITTPNSIPVSCMHRTIICSAWLCKYPLPSPDHQHIDCVGYTELFLHEDAGTRNDYL